MQIPTSDPVCSDSLVYRRSWFELTLTVFTCIANEQEFILTPVGVSIPVSCFSLKIAQHNVVWTRIMVHKVFTLTGLYIYIFFHLPIRVSQLVSYEITLNHILYSRWEYFLVLLIVAALALRLALDVGDICSPFRMDTSTSRHSLYDLAFFVNNG